MLLGNKCRIFPDMKTANITIAVTIYGGILLNISEISNIV